MAAAAGVGTSSSDFEIKERIKSYIIADSEKSGDKKYKLKFKIEESIIETTFTYYKDVINDKPAYVLDNNCISLFIYNLLNCDDPEIFSSHIYSDKGKAWSCFTPSIDDIINKNIGKPFTKTDIIQVISTKLKLSLCPNKILRITDVAVIPEHTSLLSHWRLLRGEEGIYEKYGYISPKYIELREKATSTTLGSLPPYINKIIINLFPGDDRYSASKTVSEFMKLVKYSEINYISNSTLYSILDKSEICSVYLRDTIDEDDTIIYNNTTLTGILSRALIGADLPSMLTLDPISPKWRYWDEKIKFIEWIPILGSGGRRTVRRRKSKRSRSKQRRRR